MVAQSRPASPEAIRQVRSFNRLVTERIGALEEGYLARGRPLGASRLLWEIGDEGADVRELRARLGLDSGYASRLLRLLEMPTDVPELAAGAVLDCLSQLSPSQLEQAGFLTTLAAAAPTLLWRDDVPMLMAAVRARFGVMQLIQAGIMRSLVNAIAQFGKNYFGLMYS